MKAFSRTVALSAALLVAALGDSGHAQQATSPNGAAAGAKTAAPQSAKTDAAAAPLAAPANADDQRGGWRTACARDVKQFCRSVAGGHDKRACLEANSAKISADCRASLDVRDDLRKEARRVCRADLSTHCPDMLGGKSELQCLRQKTQLLTPTCSEAMKALARGE